MRVVGKITECVDNSYPCSMCVQFFSVRLGIFIEKVRCSKSMFFPLVLDYVFGDRKFGGNAQSITKNRWIHHTSFLWDYEVSNMAYLKHPARAPEYRMVC